MTRRDAGIILWAAAGTYALVMASWLAAAYGLWIWTAEHSVMGDQRQDLYKGIFDVVLIVFVASGIALFRWRAALASWLFPESPPLPAPEGAAAPGELPSEPVAALNICALAVAAVAIRAIVACIASLGRWAHSSLWTLTHPAKWLQPGVAGGVAPLILIAAGALLLARRTRVAAWVLRPGGGKERPAGRLDVQRIGLRLFGLMLIFGNLPDLATAVMDAYGRALHEVAGHGLPAGLWRSLLPPLLSMLLGAVLLLGEDGLRSAWRRLRSQPAEEEEEPEPEQEHEHEHEHKHEEDEPDADHQA